RLEVRPGRDLHRRARDGVAGEEGGRGCVVVVADEQADVALAGRLASGRDARRAEAGRQARRIELGDTFRGRHPAGAEERLDWCREGHESPAPSSRPSITFRFWTAWPAAPFHRLSIAQKTRTRPPSAASAQSRAMFVSRTSRTPGGRGVSSTNGSPS